MEKYCQYIYETTEEHLKRHNFPANVRTCGRCFYWKNKDKLEKVAVVENPQTGAKLIWLAEEPNPKKNKWGLGCIVCKKAGGHNKYCHLVL